MLKTNEQRHVFASVGRNKLSNQSWELKDRMPYLKGERNHARVREGQKRAKNWEIEKRCQNLIALEIF